MIKTLCLKMLIYVKIAIYILILGYCGAIALVIGVGCLWGGLPSIFSELGESFAYYCKNDNVLLPSLTMILFCCLPAIITDLNKTDL